MWDIFGTVLEKCWYMIQTWFETCAVTCLKLVETSLKRCPKRCETYLELFWHIGCPAVVLNIFTYWMQFFVFRSVSHIGYHFVILKRFLPIWMTNWFVFWNCLHILNVNFVFLSCSRFGCKKRPGGPRSRGPDAQSRFVSVSVYLFFEIPLKPYSVSESDLC